MSQKDGNPTYGEVVLLEIADRAPIAKVLRQYFKTNPQFVTYLGENVHGVWAQIQDATLKGQTSNKTNDLGSFSFLVPWGHVQTLIRLDRTPAQVRKKMHA